MSCFSHVWDKHDYSDIIIHFTIFLFYHMQCFSGIWDGLLFLHVTNIPLSHYPFYKNAAVSIFWENFFSLETKYFTIYIFFRIAFFSDVPKENTLLLYLEYPGLFGGTLFFRLDDMFCLASFLLSFMFFRVLGKH